VSPEAHPSAVWATTVSRSEPRAHRRASHVRPSFRSCLQVPLASTQGENAVHPSTRGPNLCTPRSCRGSPHDAPPRRAPRTRRASRICEPAFEPRWFCAGEGFHTRATAMRTPAPKATTIQCRCSFGVTRDAIVSRRGASTPRHVFLRASLRAMRFVCRYVRAWLG
jgi:hypothetical protein